jgi:predicted nucleic acid-binding protein
MPGSIRVPEPQRERGILDTSVVLDLERLERSALLREVAITSITMAELGAGPHATSDGAERARRQDRLQRAEAAFDRIPFAAARAYGRIYAAAVARGRNARGARAVELLIAAIAAATELPLWTRNPDDSADLDDLPGVVAV